jgi:nicotinamide-nucleotide amidase
MTPAQRILALAADTGTALAARGWRVVCAESCTAGGIAYALTTVPGSSAWFERGWVTYSNASKHEELGVPLALIEGLGAVSVPVVRAMALGALARGHADLALAVSGIAGPAGGVPGKPVGTVCLGWARRVDEATEVRVSMRHFEGDRSSVRSTSIIAALEGAIEWLR